MIEIGTSMMLEWSVRNSSTHQVNKKLYELCYLHMMPVFFLSVASVIRSLSRTGATESYSYNCQGNENSLLKCRTTPDSRSCSTAGVDCALPEGEEHLCSAIYI